MSALTAWFAGRSLREKRLLVVMAILFAIVLLWAAIIRPVGDGLASSRERYRDAVLRLGSAKARVDAVKAAQRLPVEPLGAPLADAVRARADQSGFTLASLDPDAGGGVRLSIATARPAALFAWVSDLEASGILVESITVTPNQDQTVGVRMTLKARG